jgi:hypothetical protein
MLELDLNILVKKKGNLMSPPSLHSVVMSIKLCSFSVFFYLTKSASIALTAKKSQPFGPNFWVVNHRPWEI